VCEHCSTASSSPACTSLTPFTTIIHPHRHRQQFDADNDGKLSAAEIAKALVSRGVDATEEQVQMFIEGEGGVEWTGGGGAAASSSLVAASALVNSPFNSTQTQPSRTTPPPPPPTHPTRTRTRAASDTDKDHLVGRGEFASFIYHMASADLRSVSSFVEAQPRIIVPPRMQQK